MKLDVDNFAHRWTFLANFFLNTSTPRDLLIAHVFDGEGGRFLGTPGDDFLEHIFKKVDSFHVCLNQIFF